MTWMKDKSGRLLLIVGLVLALNSAYLAAFATPDLFYVINSLIHPLLGIVAAALLALFISQRWEDFKHRIGMALIFLALAATVSGIYLTAVGMTHRHSLALYLHVGFAVAALFVVLVLLRQWVRKLGPAAAAEMQPENSSSALAAWRWGFWGLAACALFYGGAAAAHHFFQNPEYIIRNPSTPPLSMSQEGGGSNYFTFPSSIETNTGKPLPQKYFMDAKSCQPCHPDIYRQWYSSMHHYSSFNNQWYRRSIEYMQDTVGIKPSLWCGGCHDQALALTGYMQKYPIREIEDTPAGQAGLTCISCHSIIHVGSTMGQADFVMEYPALAAYAESQNPVIRFLHYTVVRLDPKSHRSVFFKPFHYERQQQALFCSACHKVHMDVAVNHYRWLRGFDEYDNWQASGTDWLGARSFYYPPKPQNCVDCHMPLVRSNDFGNTNGYVHSHRFAAANTAVPMSYGDESQIAAVEHFLKGSLSVDIFALAEEPSASHMGPGNVKAPGMPETPQLATTYAVGEESSAGMRSSVMTVGQPARLIAPLGRAKVTLHRGQTVRVEVVVRTLKLGHFFPGGTVDAYDCWLELQAKDNRGHIIFWSGAVADNGRGPVDPEAHFYRSEQLDAHGNLINKRNTWFTRAVVYTHLIPPGAADTVHYRLKIPENCGDEITLTARLNYRKFRWWYTQWAFVGVHDPNSARLGTSYNYDDSRWSFTGNLSDVAAKYKQVPNVPIVIIAEKSITLPVAAGAARGETPFVEDIALNSGDRDRWNDYGIGLLLQGDLKGAERAFRVVTRLDPNYADGWVNVARAMIQEGNTDAAKPLLLRALRLNPKLGSAHYFYGLALKSDGEYPQAYHQFALAAERYPYDRVVRNQMGRLLFLQRKYRQAIEQYDKTLSVDPEDLEAHYNLMLCYRGLNDDKLAAREEKLYLRFKAYEASVAITGPYKLSHPDDNNEAQPIHEHTSIALAGLNPTGTAEHNAALNGGGLSSKTRRAARKAKEMLSRRQAYAGRLRSSQGGFQSY